ncbi:MAG: HEPN domain-containing protein [Brevundimonas sp.]|uniref:HEPN domain-containing protein n=1 Tax=Brevundimonas sp. TaxID=1871086 RepID=UPI0024873D19|nr:HEPN domain-containing protein [Brevundimonas sp.]MDI1328318.1 HEPN domain-containing protein [Brevundimonas sp.]
MIRRDYHRASFEEQRIAKRRRRSQTKGMARSLDHLPAGKRAELAFVVELLRTSFDEAISTRQAERLKNGRILRIVLYGSYARGDWVEDPVGRYFSDYDLLVVVADEAHTDVLEYWDGAERKLLAELSAGKRLRTPVSFIVHSQAEVDDALGRGRPFFVDILNDGVVIYEAESAPAFAEPQPLEREAALAEAGAHYEDWIPPASRRLELAAFAVSRGFTNEAAFELHQAAEHLYNGLLLVRTLYTPKSHNLVRLRNLAEQIEPSLAEIWPTEAKFQKRCFELLRQAYVKARYSRSYRVNAEELAWTRERIELLQSRVIALCEARLASLRDPSVDS